MNIEDIECAIARWWPDFAAIRRATGASTDEIARVVARLEAIDMGEDRHHPCNVHRPGSAACHEEHDCWCPKCVHAFDRGGLPPRLVDMDVPDEQRAAREYWRLRKAGARVADMPEWVRDGYNAYALARKRKASAA